jgi:ABC-type polysaccharide/polyol phosphate export permease
MRFREQLTENIYQTWQRRDLLRQMVVSKLIAGQKDFLLGYLWWVIEPILMTSIYWLLFHKIFARGGPDYHIFILCGLIPFKAVSGSFTQSLYALSGNLSLISQTSFPRVFLPLANIFTNHVKLLFGFLVVLMASALYYQTISLTTLFFVVPFILQIIMLCGVAMLLSVLGVYFVDLQNIVQLVTRALMFLSPIFFDIHDIPLRYHDIYLLVNPLAPLIVSYRDIFLNGVLPKPEYMLILFFWAVFVFVIGYLFFNQHERRILKCL